VAIDYDLDFVSVDAWLAAVLDDELPAMIADLDLLLDVSYVAAFRALRARGVGLSSLQLLGEPERALTRLCRASDPPRDLSRWGVEMVPLTADRVDEAIGLTRAIFLAHPEHCWFGATESHLARMRGMLVADVARAEHLQRALVRDGRLLGHVSASVRDDAFFGPVAGMSLALAPELRSRGIARSLYRRLLEGMIERGARIFRGGTSQPAVIRIGAEMGRPLQAFVMRRRTFFGDAHFAPYEVPG
jgi:GNAT superfamily N-acetyltransferase